jgi:peptidoglycan/LPS O-acetylase OafA/YrhL
VFGPDTRADGLVASAALAAFRWRFGLSVGEWAGKAALSTALVGALAARASVGWSSYGLPLFDVGACLLVAAAVSDTELAGWLAWRPLVWLGRRSYSLYLWHVPVLYAVALGRLAAGQEARLLILTVSIACAELSYRFVEQPFIRRRPATSDVALEEGVPASAPA